MATPIEKAILQHDGKLTIATGSSRLTKVWKNKEILWSEFVSRLSRTNRTGETIAEYLALPKARQDDIKDVGGFVGGALKEGKRNTGAVAWRSMLTLDADFADEYFVNKCRLMLGCAFCVYSTHKHRSEAARYRLIVPMARSSSPEESLAIGKRIAADIGLDLFDDTTFEPSRLFYWPSTSSGAEFVFEVQDEPWLEPDEVLARYADWRDPSFWPESSRTRDKRKKTAEKQGDPLAKNGLIGTFCRTYSVPDAIAEFLPDVYEPCGPGRYTYNKGTSAGGLVLYEDKFAFSHHGTDPISGQLVNAFDLVRIHKFGARDEEQAPGTTMIKLPSYMSMIEFAGKDGKVKEQLAAERRAEAEADFSEDVSWITKMKMNKFGRFADCLDNVKIVLNNEPDLAGKIKINAFTRQMEIVAPLPWEQQPRPWDDPDDKNLWHYFETRWGIVNLAKILAGVCIVAEANAIHPVREYLQSLQWDGLPRAETVLIEYLSAKDTEYTRAVTRKFFAAAVARVFVPGIKFDYMLTLIGPQGLGKSELIKRLARDWHSDSFSTVQGKEAYEQLQGAWIIEMAELTATKRAEVEAVKHFISKREDMYRVAYGRRVSHFPRQCVFVGTTNDPDCLKDQTGNRRFWPVDVRHGKATKNIWRHLTSDEIDQIWAEAVELFRCGETLYLEGELEAEAIREQDGHTQENALVGMVEDYLNRPLPLDWYELNIPARRAFIHGRCDFGEVGLKAEYLKRTRVCAMEIWVELLEGDPKNLQPIKSREITEAIRKIPGWSYKMVQRFSKPYGSQRSYELENIE